MIPDFEALLGGLVDRGVEFVLVGGYSAMLHGSSLMTRDVDVVCPMTPANLKLLFESLKHLHPEHRIGSTGQAFTEEQASREDWKNLYLRTDLGVIDCLREVTGIGDYDACLARSCSIDLGEFSLRVLSLEALIDAKRALGRGRDLVTAEELEIILERNKQG